MSTSRATAGDRRTTAVRRVRPSPALLPALLLGLLLAVLAAAPAAAHTALVEARPSGTVASAEQVRLVFSDPVQAPLSTVRVTAPGGVVAADGAPVADGADALVVPLPPSLAAGTWTVAYRVVAEDGHPVTGTATFTAAPLTPAPLTAAPTTAAATQPAPATSAPATAPPGSPTAAPQGDAAAGSGSPGLLPFVLAAVPLAVVGVVLARRRGAA